VTKQNIAPRASVLLVEDEAIVAITLKRALELAGYSVPKIISRGSDVAAAVRETEPDVIVMDIRLADQVTGIEAARCLRGFSQVPIVFVTGYPQAELAEEIGGIRGAQLLTKPAPPSLVIEVIELELSRV
jgi:two-component system, response regulator PdtaR